MRSGWQQIEDCVLQSDRCCGCGLCAGICPADALKMQLDPYGEYKPVVVGTCNGCGLCAQVCPFSAQGPNEDELAARLFSGTAGIHHDASLGYYAGCFVGNATGEMRREGASGGLLTWTLSRLMEDGHIEYAVCVQPLTGPGRLFQFTICRSVEEVRHCARSCYYPVEMSDVVSTILQNEGRYAVVGLPCVLKALRRAEQINRKLRDRVKYHLGLVCGQQKSTFFADYICALGGGAPRQLSAVQFRVKNGTRSADNYGMRFVCGHPAAPDREGTVYWTEGMGQAWCNGYFKLRACNYCDDLFAELGDAAYMDAWLPSYMSDPDGTSIVVVRHPDLVDLFRAAGPSEQVHVARIAPEDAIRSQRSGLRVKRERLADRLALARDRGVAAPVKRVRPVPSLAGSRKTAVRLDEATTRSSKLAWRMQRAVGRGLWLFRLWMAVCLFPLRLWGRILHVWSFVRRRGVALGDR